MFYNVLKTKSQLTLLFRAIRKILRCPCPSIFYVWLCNQCPQCGFSAPQKTFFSLKGTTFKFNVSYIFQKYKNITFITFITSIISLIRKILGSSRRKYNLNACPLEIQFFLLFSTSLQKRPFIENVSIQRENLKIIGNM